MIVDSHALARARWADLPERSKALILGGNAQRIFKLSSNAPPS